MKLTRRRLKEAVEEGLSVSQIASKFETSPERVKFRLGFYGISLKAETPASKPPVVPTITNTNPAPEFFDSHKITTNGIVDREVYEQVEKVLSAGETPYLVGLTGTGKTVFADWLAKKTGLPRLVVNCDIGRLRDLVGRYELVAQNGATATRFVEGLLTKFFQAPSVVLLDEVNSLEGEYLFFLHEVLNNRRFFLPEEDRVVRLHPECRVILASNPTGPTYYGTKPLNVALLSRCVVIDVPLFTEAELKRLVQDEGIKKFYYEINRLATEQRLAIGFGIREMLQYQKILAAGESPEKAITWAFLNKAKMGLEEEEYKAVVDLAKLVIGVSEVK